jgi:hypothetical protein
MASQIPHRRQPAQLSASTKEDQMNTSPNPIAPKRGERVASTQQEGVFEVADINSLMQTANLKSTDGQGHITRNVPWTALKPLHK